ncbi:mCG23705, isoform CRA_a [Mus musculus]|nr:mCG23705, isoform CRA_a [Mus musculus]EDL21362.1 mCG23705, isoform CRA_a [Mus musculus]EDL21363.1 mCG23705, isoform CRA_a [Mus musculus]
MAQRLRALSALPEVLSSIRSNHLWFITIYELYPLLARRQNAVYIINLNIFLKIALLYILGSPRICCVDQAGLQFTGSVGLYKKVLLCV